MTEYISIREVSQRVHRSEKAVRKWIMRGLPSYRPDHRIMLKWEDVTAFIERSRVTIARDEDARAILVDVLVRKTA